MTKDTDGWEALMRCQLCHKNYIGTPLCDECYNRWYGHTRDATPEEIQKARKTRKETE